MKTKFIAEMVGTMVLVLMGCGAAVLNGGATSVAAVLTIAVVDYRHNGDRRYGSQRF